MGRHQALTVAAEGLLRVIKTPIRVCVPVIDPSKGVNQATEVVGIWDTGASGSVITQSVVDALKISPISFAQVHTASGQETSPVYLIDFLLPNGLLLRGARVTLGKLAGADVLIGMDVIALGDFSITNFGGKTKMSFRVPSQAEIDYVQEAQQQTGSANVTIDGQPLSRQQRRALERQNSKQQRQSSDSK